MLGLAKSYEEIVHRYRAERCGGPIEISFFRGQRDLATAVRLAGLALGPRKRLFSHQYRVPVRARRISARRLVQNRQRLKQATDFPQLFSTVRELIGPIHGIGELTIYDTALRIGAFLGVLPDRVYLHAGVRKGATALGIGHGRASIALSDLPTPLQVLEPYEAEDVLCIFREDLRALSVQPTVSHVRRRPVRNGCGPVERHLTSACS